MRDVEVDPAVSPVGVSPDRMLDDLTADLQEQEMQELLAGQEGDEEEIEHRSKRPHLDDTLDESSHPLRTGFTHTNQV